MSERLQRLLERPALRANFLSAEVPVLVWQGAPIEKDRELLWVTNPNIKTTNGGADPLVYRVEKRKGNAFGLGITLGRATNNDIHIDHPSVSRFHAYFTHDEHNFVWHVVDAESSSGTYVGGERLPPKRPAPLQDGA